MFVLLFGHSETMVCETPEVIYNTSSLPASSVGTKQCSHFKFIAIYCKFQSKAHPQPTQTTAELLYSLSGLLIQASNEEL